jgi:4'-phosphopantetheinyl transferase
VTGDLVEVWLIRTDVADSVLAGLEPVLDDAERERAADLRYPDRRRRFIASHGAVRVILGRYLGMPPGSLRWQPGPNGKPELAGGPRVSMSASGGLAALAIAGSRRVGVDVQRLLADVDVARMADRFYPPAEARFVRAAAGPSGQVDRFTRLWARKEACVKVSGGRLLPGMRLIVLGAHVTCADVGGTSSGPCLLRDLRVPPGFRAAVAVEGTRPFRISRRWMYLAQRCARGLR